MSKPDDVLWDYEPHTAAKHRILKRYLQAWLPIMRREGTLNVVDGFAGPGRYSGGELGSPLIMLDAYLSHEQHALMANVQLHYAFIEQRADRVAHLREELATLKVPSNVAVTTQQGDFDEVISGVLASMPDGHRLAPTFAFIDPFGYTGHGMQLSSRILAFPKCEVLIYVPLPFIARFVSQPNIEPALNNLFGDDSWKAARGERGKVAQTILHDVFLTKLKNAAGLARSFQIDASDNGWSGYTLFFGTGHIRGIQRFKDAMWSVDPTEGGRFADSTDPNQLVTFGGPDFAALEQGLKAAFGTGIFTIEQAERHVDLHTAFLAERHLKTRTLRPAELSGRLDVVDAPPKRRRGTYPAGTQLRFT